MEDTSNQKTWVNQERRRMRMRDALGEGPPIQARTIIPVESMLVVTLVQITHTPHLAPSGCQLTDWGRGGW